MTSIAPLGRLETVKLREAWPDEARNFTPWLAEDPNLAFLGETLGLQLELESTEKAVGPFSADILAKEVGSSRWVLIENQIEPTDHRHLGQVLTYAAGLNAQTVIWIAESFRDEHRAAIDFLNTATTEDYSFFGVQIELFRIGQSEFAPSFSVVAKPNTWTRSAQAAKQTAEGTLTETQVASKDFWQTTAEKAAELYPRLWGKSPSKLSWQTAETMNSGKGFSVQSNAAFTMQSRLRVEIYLGGRLAKAAFRILYDARAEIEERFGSALEWEELPTGQDSRVAYYMDGQHNRLDRTTWPTLQDWLLIYWPKIAEAVRPVAMTMSSDFLEAKSDDSREGQ